MSARLLAQVREEVSYLVALGYGEPPCEEMAAEHAVHLLGYELARCVEPDGTARGDAERRARLVRVIALAALEVARIDGQGNDPHPVGPTVEQRGRGK